MRLDMLLLVFVLIAFLLAIIALIKPSLVKASSRAKGFGIYFSIAFALFIGAAFVKPDPTPEQQAAYQAQQAANESKAKQEAASQAETDKQAESKAAADAVADDEEKAKLEAEEAKKASQAAAEKAQIESIKAELAAENSKPYVTTAKKLFGDYEANEVATDARIGKHPVEIAGTIQSIDKDLFDNIIISLTTGNQFMSARMKLEDSEQARVMSAKKGQKITLICKRMMRVIGSPSGSNCTFK